MTAFLAEYGKEKQCRDQFFKWRWPKGFECPDCGCKEHCMLKNRELYQCNRCHHQTSLTTGTIMEATKLPFTVWFLAMYLMTQTKNGISALHAIQHGHQLQEKGAGELGQEASGREDPVRCQ